MSAIYLSETDVTNLLDMQAAVDAVEEAFRRFAAGEADNVPRRRAVAEGFVLHSMCAVNTYQNLAGWKCYTTTRLGARFLLGLCDTKTGALLALVEADHLGRLRTGATTGVAASWMAAVDATEVGIFGAGRQAETQLEAIATVRKLHKAFVYCRDEQRRTDFADKMSQRLELEVTPVDRPQEAAEELPIVVTATTSRTPVFDGAWLAEGTLVAAVGSNWLNKAEIGTTVIRRADKIVCDSIEACRIEAGDFIEAIDKGIFDYNQAIELSDVVSGRAVGRTRHDSLALFKSVGLAIEDVALGAKLLERAKEAGAGTLLPF